ncbi:MAG TPA: hypothetical protein VHK64_07800, partial [Nocardioidaceae bacterium]|nr:hypothetical protein [Nocardioidaceae bacterium]
ADGHDDRGRRRGDQARAVSPTGSRGVPPGLRERAAGPEVLRFDGSVRAHACSPGDGDRVAAT